MQHGDSTKRLSLIRLVQDDEDMGQDASRQGIIQRKQRGNQIAFGWYGGKISHVSWRLPQLPVAHHYCEPFAGSAAVLLHREPASVETDNEIDGEVVNFFCVLRDQKLALIEAIGLTPFSREEFYFAVNSNGTKLSDLERARRSFVRARQARTGLAQTASLGRWANCKTPAGPACRAWFRGGWAALSRCRKSPSACCVCRSKIDQQRT